MILDCFFIAGNAENDNAPELNCHEHDDWYADADAESLPTIMRRAADHVREDHRVHVDGCACRERVIDMRCVPHIDWISSAWA